MKIILEYSGDDERDEALRALRVDDFRAALLDLDCELRRREKYTDTKPESWDQVREILWQVIKDYDLGADISGV